MFVLMNKFVYNAAYFFLFNAIYDVLLQVIYFVRWPPERSDMSREQEEIIIQVTVMCGRFLDLDINWDWYWKERLEIFRFRYKLKLRFEREIINVCHWCINICHNLFIVYSITYYIHATPHHSTSPWATWHHKPEHGIHITAIPTSLPNCAQ